MEVQLPRQAPAHSSPPPTVCPCPAPTARSPLLLGRAAPGDQGTWRTVCQHSIAYAPITGATPLDADGAIRDPRKLAQQPGFFGPPYAFDRWRWLEGAALYNNPQAPASCSRGRQMLYQPLTKNNELSKNSSLESPRSCSNAAAGSMKPRRNCAYTLKNNALTWAISSEKDGVSPPHYTALPSQRDCLSPKFCSANSNERVH